MPVPSGGSAFFPPSMPSFWTQPNLYAAPMSGTVPVSSPLPFFTPSLPYASLQQLQAAAVSMQQVQSALGSQGLCSPAAPSPTFPSSVPTPSPPAGLGPGDCGEGVGTLTWLSSQAGLIRSQEMGVVSFQLKDFCDQAVHDLTSVLRPGFKLKFQALAAPGSHEWVATFVVPVHGPDAARLGGGAVDLESLSNVETGPPQLPKDPYNLDLEAKAVPMLLEIFERNGLPQYQLGNFHCHISNCGDDALYRYVGTSSLKRRQFLERRTHLFHINNSDMVSLQPAQIYTTVVTLVKQLTSRGGACLMQEIFEHFNSCPDIPLEARDMIGEGKTRFLRFLEAHPWIFAVFPSRVFVSVRRTLPEYPYPQFIDDHFPDYELRNPSPTSGYGASASASGSAVRAPRGWDESVSNGVCLTSTASTSYNSMCLPSSGPDLTNMMPSAPSTPAWGMRSPLDDFPPLRAGPPPAPIGQLPLVSEAAHLRSMPPPPLPSQAAPPGQPVANFWGVGGRIKRFTDVETQTEGSSLVDACVQTNVQLKTTACGPQDDPLQTVTFASDMSDDSQSCTTVSSCSSSEPVQSLFGFPSGPALSTDSLGAGFNPFDSPLNLGGLPGLEKLRLD